MSEGRTRSAVYLTLRPICYLGLGFGRYFVFCNFVSKRKQDYFQNGMIQCLFWADNAIANNGS